METWSVGSLLRHTEFKFHVCVTTLAIYKSKQSYWERPVLYSDYLFINDSYTWIFYLYALIMFIIAQISIINNIYWASPL